MLKQIIMDDGEQKSVIEFLGLMSDAGDEGEFDFKIVEMGKVIFLEMAEVINEEVLSESTTMILLNKYREFYLLKWKLGIEE